jgi:hypothetical protein
MAPGLRTVCPRKLTIEYYSTLATMSSGFVSGGTVDAPIERDAEWLAAQQEIEAARARKAAEARPSDGKSLFETLQANEGIFCLSLSCLPSLLTFA